MTRFSNTPFIHFRKDEDGSATIPFVIWVPFVLTLIIASIELGVVTIRHAVLERSLDVAVRDLRLGTGDTSSDGLKQTICDATPILPKCTENLHLELVRLDLRDWSAPSSVADCTDTSVAITPQRTFEFGGSHETMLVRACYKFKPATPIGTFSASLPKDSQGYTALVSTSAFVNEPG
ncbi:TadE/TadG family type IV pilus assembly protein [uncultured Pelagimonas sp.]|uniref:TadE/TadG family type IV pilus assembly protein n=1 Tax=uncultured Pelagimonas sp. TaxID=1618102 RepID=UPI002627F635|nr:TadE/TadG family type IV pilus assembly protein [uncultured Pelagimonas sp.]